MRQKLLFITASCLFLVACNKDEDQEEFDRGAMLDNMASAVIQPSYTTLNNDLIALDNAANTFTNNPDATNLIDLKAAFKTAYRSFERCKMYNFGPFMDYGIKNAMNTYPTDTAQIESNIETGSYNLGTVENVPAIGLPALDYLLYFDDEYPIVNKFTTAPNANNSKTYLTDLTGKMKDDFTYVIDNWSNYESDFIAADGNDVSSSTSYLYNELVKDIELIKNAKVGIPAGYQTGGQLLPEYVEAYYSGYSIALAQESIEGLKIAFTGGSGLGFDDYIRDVEGGDVTVSLADNINNQFDICDSKITAIGNPLSDNLGNTNASDAYAACKKLVTYCKTDMSSTLGLLITFQDNDGD